mgnify:CR=1 FL=1
MGEYHQPVWTIQVDPSTREIQSMTGQQKYDDPDERDTDHLDDVEDGCGCTEIWEHLSEQRDDAAADD